MFFAISSSFSGIDKKEVLGRLFISLHYNQKGKTYTYHLRNSKMEHLANTTIEFELDYNFNQFLAGAKMFTPRGQIYWNDEKTEVSLSRISELVTRIKSHIVTPDFAAFVQAVDDVRSWKR